MPRCPVCGEWTPCRCDRRNSGAYDSLNRSEPDRDLVFDLDYALGFYKTSILTNIAGRWEPGVRCIYCNRLVSFGNDCDCRK